MHSLAKSFFVLVLLGWSCAAWSAPGHYIVVTVDAQGQVHPVYYRAVELAERRPASSSQLKLAQSDPEKLLATVGTWSEVAEAPRFLRGEFAKNGISGKIESYRVRATDRAFALRIPAHAGNTVELKFLGARSQFRLDQLASKSQQLPLGSQKILPMTQPAPNPSNRVDILVMGDGYQASEQATFNAHAEGLRATMFGFTPYREYANLVNWNSYFVASSQSGADHPPYQAECTETSCCADTTAQTDPRAGLFVNTAFDGKFCTSQIHRLATVNSSKVLAAASARPDWDQIIVILNDPVYGGAGGGISVVSANGSSDLVAVHEYAHTFHGLADEYTSPYPGYPACDDVSGGPPCAANVTNQTTRSLIKWNSWLTPGIVIPTPAGTAGIGLFEGARYQTSGMYRPANTCGMRDLGAPFCAVCSQAYVLKLYSGGFGAPANGIDLIEPGSEIPAFATPVNYVLGSSVNFRATVLRPTPDTTSMQWYLDGQPIAGATGPSYDFKQTSAFSSSRILELRVIDNTPLVKIAMAGSLLLHSRTWNIRMGSVPGDFDGDRKADLLWRHGVSGSNSMWRSANSTQVQTVRAITDVAWVAAGVGDFNGDGKADILWNHKNTGANAVWYSANHLTAQNLTTVTNLTWKIVGVGDFDGDGKSDILWRNTTTGANAYWRSGNYATQVIVREVTDVAWRVAGVGDFNGEGKADILWNHRNTGANALWFSANPATAQNLTTVTNLAWKIVGVGDFDGDGKADILWRNSTTGANAYWRSGSYATQAVVREITDVGWKAAAVGDYNGDGKADVMWRHSSTGANAVWYSANHATAQNLSGIADQNWKLMPLASP